MASIKIIEIKSDIGAGARGAGLGIDAIKAAAWYQKDNFFTRYETEEIPNENHLLFQPLKYPLAKYIEGMYKIYGRVSKKIKETLLNEAYPIVLAGDHATAGGTIAGIKMAYPKARIGVIWVDAHADLHTPFTTPSGNIHGMPLATALNEDNLNCKKQKPNPEVIKYWNKLKQTGNITPKVSTNDIVIIGLRSYEKEETALIKKYKIHTFSVEDIHKKGAPSIANESLSCLKNCGYIYLSFDVDSMDPSVSKGTGTPVNKGFYKEETIQLLTAILRDKRVCCFEIAEINPLLDTKNKMAETAFEILTKTLGVIQMH